MSYKSLFRWLFLLVSFFSLTAWADNLEPLMPITQKTAMQLYNPTGNTVAGNPNGSVTLVEVFDYNCPSCRSFQPQLLQLIKNNPDLRVVYKEYLLFGDASRPAASAAFAAQLQDKYLAMHDAMFNAQQPLQMPEIMRIAKTVGINTQQFDKDMRSAKVAQLVQDNENLANQIKIEGTPTFIVANSAIAQNPNANTKQYIYKGSDGASDALQKMIDAIKKG